MGFDSGSFRVIFQGPPIKYRLYAVLVHSGYSSNSGHYYCYIRASNGVWYQMNDSIVSEKRCFDNSLNYNVYRPFKVLRPVSRKSH